MEIFLLRKNYDVDELTSNVIILNIAFHNKQIIFNMIISYNSL